MIIIFHWHVFFLDFYPWKEILFFRHITDKTKSWKMLLKKIKNTAQIDNIKHWTNIKL